MCFSETKKVTGVNKVNPVLLVGNVCIFWEGNIIKLGLLFRRLIEWFTCVRLSESHQPRSCAVTFPQRSPPWLLTTAA